MEIQLISSEKFYITEQDNVFYKRYSGRYNGIHIESVNCPEFNTDDEDTLFLRGDMSHRNGDSIKVPREKMKQVLTALSLCCIANDVTLTIKL